MHYDPAQRFEIMVMQSAGPFGATRLLGMDVDLCALLTVPVMLFLRSDQSLLYCSLGLLRSRYLKV